MHRCPQILRSLTEVIVSVEASRHLNTKKYIYVYTLPANCIALVGGPERGPEGALPTKTLEKGRKSTA